MPRVPAPFRRRPRALALLGVALLAVAPSLASAQAKPRPGTLPGSTPAEPPRPTRRPTAPGTAAPRPPAPPAVRPDSMRRMPVGGIVTDSIAGVPLADATVQMASDQDRSVTFTAQTDSVGRWRVPAVMPGRYLVGFFHPTLDALGIQPPVTLVDIQPDTAARLDLGTPGPTAMRAQVCPNTPADRAVLLGSVADAEGGMPVPGARVIITWSEIRVNEEGIRNVKRRLPVAVRPDGGYLACDLPAETDLVANAEAPKRRGGLIELRLPPRTLTRRDFGLGDSASVVTVLLPDTMAAREGRLEQPQAVARGNAALTGTVRTRDGRPLRGAKVQLWGSDVSGTTTESGTFALAGLPSGTYALEIRAIGFAPRRVPVTLSARRPNSASVVLDQPVNTLSSVVVSADRTKAQKDMTGFLERSKRGMGRYMNEEEISKRNAIAMSDVFRTVPSIRVVPNGTGFGYALQGRGNCAPDVFVDGMRLFDGATDLDQIVRPNEVAGVEVYTGAGTAPAQFMTAGGNSGCGTVVIWTKRGGPAGSSP